MSLYKNRMAPQASSRWPWRGSSLPHGFARADPFVAIYTIKSVSDDLFAKARPHRTPAPQPSRMPASIDASRPSHIRAERSVAFEKFGSESPPLRGPLASATRKAAPSDFHCPRGHIKSFISMGTRPSSVRSNPFENRPVFP